MDIDNVNKDKSPFSNGEGGFRGMGLVLKSMARTITALSDLTPARFAGTPSPKERGGNTVNIYGL